MLQSLGLSEEQVYGDVYNSWLRDTHEKNTPDSKLLFRDVVESGFLDRRIVLRRQRLGVNVMNSLATVLHRSSLTKLDLHGNALRDLGCEVLAHFMRDLPQLLYLDIGSNDIGGSSMHSLGTAVALHRKLSTLILGSHRNDPYANHLTPTSATVLLEGCVRSRSLRHLDLSGNPFAGSGGTGSLGGGGGGHHGGGNAGDLTSPKGATTTASSRLNGGGTATVSPLNGTATTTGAGTQGAGREGTSGGAGGGAVLRRPVEVLEQLLRVSTTLTTLKLREVGLNAQGAQRLLGALADNSTLLQLDISYNALSPVVGEVLGELLRDRVALRNSVAVKALILSGNDLFGTAARHAAEDHDFGASAKLAAAARVAPSSSSAASTAAKRRVGSAGEPRKRRSPTPQPTVLAAAPTGGRSVHFSNSAAAAASPHSPQQQQQAQQQRTLSASHSLGNAFTATMTVTAATTVPLPVHPAANLLAALANDRHLTTLDLDRCGLTDDVVLTLCHALTSNSALRHLSLQCNELTATGAVALGQALVGHPALKELCLAGNCIEDDGACSLASVLEDSELLEELDLQRTWLGDRGLIALGVALQRNRALRVLLLGDNHFTNAGGESFVALVEKNETILRCHLGATSVPYPTVARLQRCLARNANTTQNAEPDALKKEVVRLHFQKYKLSEAKGELENLREKGGDLKRTMENFELQCKQDQADFTKKINELEEQMTTYSSQSVRYREQVSKLQTDLVKAAEVFADDMELAKQRLEVEAQLRQKVEAEHQQVAAELDRWLNEKEKREADKRGELVTLQADQEHWAAQRKEYREQTDAVLESVKQLEAQLAQSKRGSAGPKRSGSANSKKGKKK